MIYIFAKKKNLIVKDILQFSNILMHVNLLIGKVYGGPMIFPFPLKRTDQSFY